MTAARSTNLKRNSSELSPSFFDHISLKKKKKTERKKKKKKDSKECSSVSARKQEIEGIGGIHLFNPLQPP